MLKLALAAAAGGAIGSGARYVAVTLTTRLVGTEQPWGTFLVNMLGAFLMGLLVGLFALRDDVSQTMRVFLLSGVLGGFTTFSAFAFDLHGLVERKMPISAIVYASGSVLISVLLLLAGLLAGRILQS
jgi:CrcB protein